MTILINALKGLGNDFYRIDWLGNVVQRHVSAHSTPTVKIALSKIGSEDQRSLNEKQIEIALPIAFLRLIRVGDVWQNGKKISDGQGERLTFANVEVNNETVDIKPVGFPIETESGMEFPLPFDQYNGHREYTCSQSARIKIDEKTILFVPCMELIRFYFGGSGAMLSKIFSGPIAGKDLYESVQLNAKQAATIKLARDIPGIAAPMVARIALDRQAENALNRIINSGVSAAANDTDYYPTTRFPFIGKQI